MTPMKLPLLTLMIGAVFGGLVLGAGSALLVIYNGQELGQTRSDGWLGNRSVGSSRADPWTRAIIARTGLLALNRSETIYFTRYRDDQDRPLRADCDYALTGEGLPSRWWSVSIYGADDFLPPNTDHAYSIDATRIVAGPDGHWTATIGQQRGEAVNWISSKAAGTFSLTLRIYNPTPEALASDTAIAFPALRRLACPGDAS